ncbi:unnamed protein product [Orchesella dallaii]|uniref:Uncharacterized protein n=1 Tax=Orchesella dallaii TaxID=48710 RepID=A0ABP1RZI1_9HEXA
MGSYEPVTLNELLWDRYSAMLHFNFRFGRFLTIMFLVGTITNGVGQSEGITVTVQWFLLALTSSLLVIQFLQKKKKDGNSQEKSRRSIPGPGQHFLGSLANIFALRNPRS